MFLQFLSFYGHIDQIGKKLPGEKPVTSEFIPLGAD